jgi:hypothetical protein
MVLDKNIALYMISQYLSVAYKCHLIMVIKDMHITNIKSHKSI